MELSVGGNGGSIVAVETSCRGNGRCVIDNDADEMVEDEKGDLLICEASLCDDGELKGSDTLAAVIGGKARDPGVGLGDWETFGRTGENADGPGADRRGLGSVLVGVVCLDGDANGDPGGGGVTKQHSNSLGQLVKKKNTININIPAKTKILWLM